MSTVTNSINIDNLDISGDGPSLLLVPRHLIHIDPSYKRNVNQALIAQIVANYNKEAFGVFTVGLREDLRYWLIDGLQRDTAASLLGITHVWCLIYKSTGGDKEAGASALINGSRSKDQLLDTFNNEVRGGVPESASINSIVEAEGYHVSKYPLPYAKRTGNQIQSIKTLRTIFRMQDPPLRPVLSMLHRCFRYRDGATYGAFLTGFALFLRVYWYRTDIESRKLQMIEAFRRIEPVDVIEHANPKLFHGDRLYRQINWSVSRAVCLKLCQIYQIAIDEDELELRLQGTPVVA